MREAFGGTALFMIVIFFVVLFTGYLCMSINQNKAFAVKNSIIRIIERHGIGKNNIDGLSKDTTFQNEVKSELEAVGYRTRGVCDTKEETGWTGFGVNGKQSDANNPTVFCVKEVSSTPTAGSTNYNPSEKLHYYKVKTFYQFDIPLFTDLFQWTIEGTTKAMM